MRSIKKEYTPLIILLIFSAFIFFTGLGNFALTDPDEVFYAETAREMQVRGEFLTPYIFGEPQFEKPPFYYWLVKISFSAFGVNEFSARLPSAIFGLFGVVGIFLLGRALFNKRTGFLAGLILASNIKYVVLARACVTDIILCVFILYAFLFFFLGYKNVSGKKPYYLLTAFFLGLAVLTKGPVGILLPGAIIIGFLLFTKDIGRLRKMPWLSGSIIFLAVSLPWYLLMYKAHGKEFIDMFFGFHNIIRYLEPEHKIGDNFYFYLPVMLGGFFPWSLFLPVGVWQMFREKAKDIKKINIFLILWVLVIFVFFSISRTKLVTYIFPLYPALALIAARFLDLFPGKALSKKQKRVTKGLVVFSFIALAGGLFGLSVIARVKYPAIANNILIVGAVFLITMFLVTMVLAKKKYRLGGALFMLSFGIFLFSISHFILPPLGKYESSKFLSKKLLAFAKPGEAFAAETDYTRGVAFYTKRENVPDIHPNHLMTGFLSRKDRVWAVIKEKNFDQLYDDLLRPFDKSGYIVYKMGKKVIVTNKFPRDGKYLRMRKKNVSR